MFQDEQLNKEHHAFKGLPSFSFEIQNASPKPGNSAFEGEYSEEESAASFAAALAEWRQVREGGQQNGVGGQGAKKDGMSIHPVF